MHDGSNNTGQAKKVAPEDTDMKLYLGIYISKNIPQMPNFQSNQHR
jgi:hypothetical protein